MNNTRTIAALEKTIAQLTTLKDRLTAADAKAAGVAAAPSKKAAKKTAVKKTPAKKRAAKSIE